MSSNGIARYQGLIHMDLGEGDMEFLELHYANDAKLYVPVSAAARHFALFGADPTPRLCTRSARSNGKKAKRRRRLQARDTAAELLPSTPAARQGSRLRVHCA